MLECFDFCITASRVLIGFLQSVADQTAKENEIQTDETINERQGSYRQDCVKFKDFSRTSKRLSYCFQGMKLRRNTDLHLKILLLKC